jgi:tetratricopeptide (TPR) repeat protein/transcriptional regulator with XRE-family HTH domain
MESIVGTPNHALRLARERKGWTQEQLAEQIGASAISVHRWEGGAAFPNHYYRQKLCDLFGLDVEALGLVPAVSASTSQIASDQHHATLPGKSNAPDLLVESIPPLVPPPPRKLIGRDEVLAALKKRLLAVDQPKTIALSGLPGVGKTAMLSALAYDEAVCAAFPDGVLWAGLGPSPNLAALLGGWGVALGLKLEEIARLNTVGKVARTLCALIAARRCLLVIDDAWQIEHALAFKIGGIQCIHLVTTRSNQLAFQFAGSDTFHIPELSPEAAVDLLATHAPNVVGQELEPAHHLAQLAGYLPLALILIGHYLQSQALAGQPRRVRQALDHIQNVAARMRLAKFYGPTEAPPALQPGRHLSLEAAISVSDEALSADARQALLCLAVFPPKPNSFSEEMALAVAATAAETLDALVDAGLLESYAQGRYALHQAIADYARLQGAPEQAEERLVEKVVGFLESHQRDYSTLEPEGNTIFAALDVACRRGLHQWLVRGVISWHSFLEARGLYDLATTYLRHALEAARLLNDQSSVVTILLYLGRVAKQQEKFDDAAQFWREGEHLARQGIAREQLPWLLNGLGTLARREGRFAQAEEYLQEGLTLARQLGSVESRSALLISLGSLAGRQGQNRQAEQCFEEAWQLALACEDFQRAGPALQGLAWMAARQSKFAQSERYLQEGLLVARRVGYREGIRGLVSNLGALALDHGNLDAASRYLQEGLEISRTIGHSEGICSALANLAEVAARQGKMAQAEMYAQEGRTLARELGHQERLCSLLLLSGDLVLRQGKREEAEVWLTEGVNLACALLDRWRLSALLSIWGQLELARHDWGAAQRAFEEALKLAGQVESPERAGAACYGLAQVAAERGHLEEARQQAQESLQIFNQIGYYQAAEVQCWLEELADKSE